MKFSFPWQRQRPYTAKPVLFPEIIVGAFYTLGVNKRTGDRSYIEQVWKCQAYEGGETCAMRPATKGFWGKDRTVLFNLHERDFERVTPTFFSDMEPADKGWV